MVLTRGDDYPIHQTPEPIAYAGTDRNFYDRYFFNGYHPSEGGLFFAVAFGVYPQLNIADAAFSVTLDGVQTSVHASRWLGMERMDLRVGPITIEVLEPLRRLRVRVDAPEHGLHADLVFEGRSPPIEEPRFMRRLGPRAFMDYTRLTQNGRWTGWVERDGQRDAVDGYVGTRDRSWGVRPVGARDPQELAPPEPPQFYWLWGPSNFAGGAYFFHSNDDAHGRPWNRRHVWATDDGPPGEEDDFTVDVRWRPGTRHAERAVVTGWGGATITYEPEQIFFMIGIGYGHPRRAHGLNQGALSVEREDLRLADADVRLPHHLHIQALSKVTYRQDGREEVGRGVLEQLVIGPHAPSGFTDLLDMAK